MMTPPLATPAATSALESALAWSLYWPMADWPRKAWFGGVKVDAAGKNGLATHALGRSIGGKELYPRSPACLANVGAVSCTPRSAKPGSQDSGSITAIVVPHTDPPSLVSGTLVF